MLICPRFLPTRFREEPEFANLLCGVNLHRGFESPLSAKSLRRPTCPGGLDRGLTGTSYTSFESDAHLEAFNRGHARLDGKAGEGPVAAFKEALEELRRRRGGSA